MVNLEAYKKACVNKAKPMMHCNGKCQMLKKLKKQEGDNGTSAPAPKYNQPDFVLSSVLLRAIETGVYLFPNHKIIINSHFLFFNSGCFLFGNKFLYLFLAVTPLQLSKFRSNSMLLKQSTDKIYDLSYQEAF
jgi:hypothetical protein